MQNDDGWYVSLHTITAVNDTGVTVEDGWSIFVDFTDKPPLSPGDVAEFYSTSNRLGGRVRGMFVNDIEYIKYQTREEAETERLEWLANYEREKRERYVKNSSKWLESKDRLREPLRKRIERFEEMHGVEKFWTEDGGYELFVCEQADRLLDYAESQATDGNSLEQVIDAWSKLSYDEQAKMPGFDDGHSGNTFGGMVYLAKSVALGLEV